MVLRGRDYQIIAATSLYSNFKDSEIKNLIEHTSVDIVNSESCDISAYLYKYSAIILEGTLDLIYLSPNGSENLIMRLHAGNYIPKIIFEMHSGALSVSVNPSKSNCRILLLDYEKINIFSSPSYNSDIILKKSDTPIYISTLAQLNYNIILVMKDFLSAFNQKIQLITQKNLRDKLYAYLNDLEDEKNIVTLPLNREELANYIFADRSAVSREFSNMQNDNLIKIHSSKKIEILQ